ncbi:MAG: S24 family peptidase [Desulfosalsimonas sp.]
MMHLQKFRESFKKAMESPDAPKKSELARQIGVTPGYISSLLKGRGDGTEETRRAIAAALGKEYEEMAGFAVSQVDLRAWVLPQLNLSDYVDVNTRSSVTMVPVVDMEAALCGRIRKYSQELQGWFGVVDIRNNKGLVAVRMPDDSMCDALPQDSLLIVDLLQTRYEDGGFYLVGPPSRRAVRQLFIQDQVLILSSLSRSVSPQVLPLEDYDQVVCGKIVAHYRRPGLDKTG